MSRPSEHLISRVSWPAREGVMHHEVFGEILFEAEEQAWRGWISLPEFARYGQDGKHLSIEEPDEHFRRGLFPLTLQIDPARENDSTGSLPLPQQAKAVRFLHQNEDAVCRAVLTELLKLQQYRGFWGWLNRKLGLERQTVEELRPDVRCYWVQLSYLFVGDYAYAGFGFRTRGMELSVVYHPERGAHWGDWSAIDYIEMADNFMN